MKKKISKPTFALSGLCIFFLSSFFFIRSVKDDDYIFPEIKHFPTMPKTKAYKITNKGVELGRYLFYDPVLSADSSISCSGCHRQASAFSYDPNYIFTKDKVKPSGSRNVLPLFNLAWLTTFFWDGRVKSLEEQISHPIRHAKEMNSSWTLIEQRINRSSFYKPKIKELFGDVRADSVMITNLISQFERTLLSYNSKFDKVMRAEMKFTADESEGYKLMLDTSKGNCFSCHTLDVNHLKPKSAFSNNGLYNDIEIKQMHDSGRWEVTKNAKDIGKFRIPSLRNLGFTGPYMHNGKFHYLDFVINFYSDGVKSNSTIDKRMKLAKNGVPRLTSEEKRKIMTFLSTLNDSVFVNNKAFSNPFIN